METVCFSKTLVSTCTIPHGVTFQKTNIDLDAAGFQPRPTINECVFSFSPCLLTHNAWLRSVFSVMKSSGKTLSLGLSLTAPLSTGSSFLGGV
jgi:hypothetical protein